MNRFLLKITLVLSIFIAASALEKYVSPYQSCGLTCSGDLDQPYDNLLIALLNTQTEDDFTIFLLNDPTASHYILSKEYDQSSSGSFLYELSITAPLTLNQRIIQPVFCGEEPVLSNPSLAAQCISRDEKLTVYLKTTQFTINILQSMQIRNIAFDASEDISVWNTDSEELRNCIYSRQRCCDPNAPSGTSIICIWYGDYSGFGLTPTTSLISLKSTEPTSSVSFITNNTDFSWFLSPNLVSLINTGSNPFSLELDSGTINVMYFSIGLIYHDEDSATSTLSSISLTNMNFWNYNPYDILLVSNTRTEGFLLFGEGYYYGDLVIQNSQFEYIATSVRNDCAPLTSQYYNIPLDNTFVGVQVSKTDLWNLFHLDHRNVQNSSSLILLTTFDGTLSIANSIFSNIFGTSGSVLRVDDVTHSDTSFTITDSLFDNNFGYDGFSNIRISKQSNGAFSKMLSCPKIEVIGSNFTNAYGCPGAYGNVLFLCYWDTTPATSGVLSSYITSDDTASLADYWANNSQPEDAYITVKNCLFYYNMMSVSNSLAIIGSPFNFLEGNTFQMNGGTTEGIFTFRIYYSYYYQRYPSRVDFNAPLVHFGQATAAYIDRFIRLQSNSNQYISNWGPWELSFALAESLTVKNWIRLADTLNLYSDSFTNHQGIPSYEGQYIWDNSLRYNWYRAPIVAFSYDDTGTQSIYTQIQTTNSNLTTNIKIIMDGVTFSNNAVMYYFNDYTYNYANLQTILTGITAYQTRFTTGLIKFLTVMESQDIPLVGLGLGLNPAKKKTGFILKNSYIIGNQLQGLGCLFPTQWNEAYFIVNTQIIGNTIDSQAEYFQVINSDAPDLRNMGNNKQGLFCMSIGDTMQTWYNTSLIVNKVTVKDNNGIMFNFAANIYSYNVISESHFENNTCWASSMITIFSYNFLSCYNNTFINNFNTVGNIFIYQLGEYEGVYQSYFNNSGIHASVMYTSQATDNYQTEVLARAYWNDINPQILMFAGGNMAQGAPYFFDSSYIVISMGDFRQNKAYSGLINSLETTIWFDSTNISDHYIAGVSVAGTFMSMSNIYMNYCELFNNSITSRPDIVATNIGVMVLYTTRYYGYYVDFINGTVDGGGVLFFGNTANYQMVGNTIQNYTKLDNVHSYLVWLTFTYTYIQDLLCNNVTNLFNMVDCVQVNITDLNIQNLQVSYETQFIFQGFETNLRMSGLVYTSNEDTGSSTALFTGDKNYIELSGSSFINAKSQIFSLQGSTFFYLGRNQFIFDDFPNQVTVIELDFANQVIIESCVFKAAGQVLNVDITQSELVFVNNIILTNSMDQNIIIESARGIIFKQNYIINEGTAAPMELVQSQVQVIDSSNLISFSNNYFGFLQSLESTVFIQGQTTLYNVSFIGNTFFGNNASYGGAILIYAKKGWSSLQDPEARIQSSVFLANKALYIAENGQGSGKGGAIYLQTLNSTRQSTLIEDSIFVGNQGEEAGGAIYFEYSPPSIDDKCIFKKNYIEQENHIASYPVRLAMYDPSAPLTLYVPNQSPMRTLSNEEQIVWEGIGSGVSTPGPYQFALLDMYNQVVGDDSSSELQVWPSGYASANRSDFTPDLSITANHGVYTLGDFVFNYKINQTLNVMFNSSAIQNDPNNPYVNVTNSISVVVSFRECKVGEYPLETDEVSRCIECQAGYWYLGGSEFGSTCTQCDMDSTICLGGANVGPKAGYWRLNGTASIVHACPTSSACLGNIVDPDDANNILDPVGHCSSGFKGNLCNNCIDGWAKTSSNSKCIDCNTNVLQYFQLVGLILLQVAYLAYNVKKTMEISTEYFKNKGDLELKNNAAILLRILTNYMQIVALVGEIPVTWPTIIKDAIDVTSKASSANTDVFSVDCFFLMAKEATGIRLVFLKVAFIAIIPFIYIAGGALFWVIYFLIKRIGIRGNRDFTNKLITTIVIICFNLQSSVIKTCFQLFQCTNLYRDDSPILFLTSDYDVQCWESEHSRWAIGLGLPGLLFWGIGLPLGMFIILRRNYRKLDSPEIVKKYVFLYLGYKKDRFYWEFVIMLRKLLLICISVFAGFHSINLQIYLVVIVIILSLVLQNESKPYSDLNLNNLEMVALASAGVVDFCGLYFQIVGDIEGLNTIMIVLGLAGNLYFIIKFVKLFFVYQLEQIKKNEKAMKIIDWIGNKCCCCFKTRSAKRTMTRVKTLMRKSKTKITRSLKLIVSDEELNDLNINTLAPSKLEVNYLSPSQSNMAVSNDNLFLLNSAAVLNSAVTSRERELEDKEDKEEDLVQEDKPNEEVNNEGDPPIQQNDKEEDSFEKNLEEVSQIKSQTVSLNSKFFEGNDEEEI